jgi:flagellum-specific peptidoglycan hydrolase FlgJ
MTQSTIFAQTWAYICQHWFKFSLLLVILFACFRKELSFSVKLNAAKSDKKEQKQASDNKITASYVEVKGEDTPLSIFGNMFSSNDEVDKMPDIDDAVKVTYIRRFAPVAIAERKKYGIPSSIIIANALRHSYAGQRDITTKLNNHFALPYTMEWSGAGETIGKRSYRKYENAWTSFRDHSILITSGAFSKLHSIGTTDYKGWAEGLQRLGYPSKSENLAHDLIEIIEAYGLEKLDKM